MIEKCSYLQFYQRTLFNAHMCRKQFMKYKFNYEIINNVTTCINADSYEDAIKQIDIFKESDKFDAPIDIYFQNRESNYFTYRLLGSETLETVKKKVKVNLHFDLDAYKTFFVEVAKDEQDDIDYADILRDEVSNTNFLDNDIDIQWSDATIRDVASVMDANEHEEQIN